MAHFAMSIAPWIWIEKRFFERVSQRRLCRESRAKNVSLSQSLSLVSSFPCLTNSPFFAEEFHFEIPRRFRHLSFYLHDENKSDPEKALGKVAIKREDLNKYHGKDHWFPISAVGEDSEVQGKIHFSIKIDHVLSSKTGLTTEKLAVRWVRRRKWYRISVNESIRQTNIVTHT